MQTARDEDNRDILRFDKDMDPEETPEESLNIKPGLGAAPMRPEVARLKILNNARPHDSVDTACFMPYDGRASQTFAV